MRRMEGGTPARRKPATDATSGFHPAVESVAQDFLETLEALAIVYESAESLTQKFHEKEIANYVLDRMLDAIEVDCGVVYLRDEAGLQPVAERLGGASLLVEGAPEQFTQRGRAVFINAPEARDFFKQPDGERSLLFAPIVAGESHLGLVILIPMRGIHFTTIDLKLVTAVTSQAAIALSGTYHFREVLNERAKLRSVIEDNGEGIVVLTPEGGTVLTNSVARRHLGIPDEEKTEDIRILDRLREWRLSYDVSVFHGPGPEDVKVEMSSGRPPDERVLSVHVRRISEADGRLVNIVLTFHDLTEKRREERLKRDFLALISHKFRTPITAMIGIVTMLQEEAEEFSPDAEERRELMEAVRQRIEELGVLVDRLLCFAEVMEGSWATGGEADLAEVVDSLRVYYEERLGVEGVQFEVLIPPEARLIRIPTSRLRVVLDNLIDNAIKFSAMDVPFVRIAARRSREGRVEIDVEDRGEGVPEREREKIFESFYQRDEYFTGLLDGIGLGLPLVKEIVSKVGGAVSLTPKADAGSIFTVTLPLAAHRA